MTQLAAIISTSGGLHWNGRAVLSIRLYLPSAGEVADASDMMGNRTVGAEHAEALAVWLSRRQTELSTLAGHSNWYFPFAAAVVPCSAT